MPSRIIKEIAHGFPLSVTFADVSVASHPLIYANPAFCDLTGYDEVEILGRNCSFLQGDASSPVHIAAFTEAIREGRTARVSITNYRKDGTAFINDVTIEPVRDGSGAPVLYLGTQRDAEEPFSEDRYSRLHDMLRNAVNLKLDDILAARRSHGSLTQAVLQTLPSRVIATDGNGLVAFANRAALMLLELPLYEVLGRPVAEVFDSRDIGVWCSSPREQGEHDVVFGWRSRSGVERELMMSVVCLGSREASEVSRIFVCRDIAEWRGHELDMRRIPGVDALKEMAAGFAHEVRNPLAALRSIAEALHHDAAEQDTNKKELEALLRHVDRIDQLTSQTLRFGRPTQPAIEVHNAVDLIVSALDALASRLHPGPSPILELEARLPDVLVDSRQITETVTSLVENALDSVVTATRVRVKACVDAETYFLRRFVRVDVMDDGAGIDRDDLQRVFDPFFTTKPKRTGLGLAIAQRLARNNGGHLIVTSTPHAQTIFSLFLPVALS